MCLLMYVPHPDETKSLYYAHVEDETQRAILGKHIFCIPDRVKFKCLEDLADKSIHHLHVYNLKSEYPDLEGIANPKNWNFSLCKEIKITNLLASKIDSIALMELEINQKCPPREDFKKYLILLDSLIDSLKEPESNQEPPTFEGLNELLNSLHSIQEEDMLPPEILDTPIKAAAEASRSEESKFRKAFYEMKKEVSADFYQFAKQNGIDL